MPHGLKGVPNTNDDELKMEFNIDEYGTCSHRADEFNKKNPLFYISSSFIVRRHHVLRNIRINSRYITQIKLFIEV